MTLAQDDVRRTATVDGITISYYDSSPSDEEVAQQPSRDRGSRLPLVMLHGGGPGASAWSNFGAALPGFAQDFRTILIDQPGFGGSDKPPVEGNYYRFAAKYVIGLLDQLGLDRVHLLGNSLGGGTAMRLALEHPGAWRAGADGPGRPVLESLPRRPDRGGQAAHGVRCQSES